VDFEILEKTTRRGSALVVLTDAFTGEEVTLPVEVGVTAGDAKPVPKGNARFGFLELATGDYALSVKSDYFFPITVEFYYEVSGGYTGPIIKVLEPAATYPFPSGTTLLRGVVIDAAEKPVEGASVWVVERPEFNAETDGNGEFVMYFKDLEYTGGYDSDFFKIFQDGKWVYYVVPKGGSEQDIELSVRAEKGAGTGEVKVKVIAEKTNTLGTDGNPIKIKLST
jgi:hypothetical protein